MITKYSQNSLQCMVKLYFTSLTLTNTFGMWNWINGTAIYRAHLMHSFILKLYRTLPQLYPLPGNVWLVSKSSSYFSKVFRKFCSNKTTLGHFEQRESFMNMNNGFSNAVSLFTQNATWSLECNHWLFFSRYRQKHSPGCLAERKASKTLSQWWKRLQGRNRKEKW